VDGAEKVTDRRALLPATAARSRTASRLAAAVAGVAGGLRTTVASTAGGLAAAVAGVAGRLAAAVAAAVVLPLALLEQALQPAEEVMLLPDTAARSRSAGRLAAAVAGTAGGLAAAVAGIAGRLTAAIAGVAAGLTARGTALVAEHPIEELETEGLGTNSDAENQRTEKHHTLH
jgi:hypothetical protein